MAKVGITKAERLAARWAPADGVREDLPLLDVVIWRYLKGGIPMACAYLGAKAKPEFHHPYGSPEARESHLSDWLAVIQSRVNERAAHKEYHKAHSALFLASLQLGDIFYYTGGYEQTNAYFFQVVGPVKGNGVRARPIEQDTIESAPMAMRGHATPRKGVFSGPERLFTTTKRIPTKWKEGERVSVTWYG